MKLHPSEIETALDNMVILVDTREQGTPQAQRRWARLGECKRQKLNFGDYSAMTELSDGTVISLADKFVVERKMDLEELANCFGTDRARFEREFNRAKDAKGKIVLLVENASWQSIYLHRYKSRLKPSAMIAAIFAWLSRYDYVPIFCTPDMTPSVMRDMLRYALREELKNYEPEVIEDV